MIWLDFVQGSFDRTASFSIFKLAYNRQLKSTCTKITYFQGCTYRSCDALTTAWVDLGPDLESPP